MSHRNPAVLIVDDAQNWRELFSLRAKRMGFNPVPAGDLEQARKALRQQTFRLAIVDVRLLEADTSDISGLTLVREAWESQRVDRFILVSAHGVEPLVLQELGSTIAYDFVSKDNVDGELFRAYVADKPGNSAITWLHLADLHFRAPENFNQQTVLREMLEDIASSMRREHLQPDFIAITGDLAFSGRGHPADATTEYGLANGFVRELLNKTDVAPERLFIVPGNHDVDRKKVGPGDKILARALASRDEATEVLEWESDRVRLLGRFDDFACCAATFSGSNKRGVDRLFSVEKITLRGQRVAVICLNSAWLSASDRDETDKLVLGEWQVRKALELTEPGDIKIALLHHPLSLLRDWDEQTSGALLQRRCDFILHGHLHRMAINSVTSPDNSTAIIAGGASYETREYHNLYNFVRYDPATRRGKVYLRQYSDQAGGFWTEGVTNYRNARGGVCQFRLVRA